MKVPRIKAAVSAPQPIAGDPTGAFVASLNEFADEFVTAIDVLSKAASAFQQQMRAAREALAADNERSKHDG